MPRRLISLDDVVYATLGLDQPLVALDAATGETIRTYENTKTTEEVIHSDGVLFLLVNDRPVEPDKYTWNNPVCWTEGRRVAKERPWDQKKRKIMAIEAATGKALWSKDYAVAPLTLAADDVNMAFHDGEKVVCLDRTDGRRKWASDPVKMRLPLPTLYAPTLVLYKDVVLFAGGNRKMSGFDAETGEHLWTGPHHRAGHQSPEDIIVIDDIAWTGELAGRGSNKWTGYNYKTGKVEREFEPDLESYWFHHRCHRSKATSKYLLPSRTGIEFVDWREQTWNRNHWVRGACVYGVMPCNGLTYAPQHPCACYVETKLSGFNALAAASEEPLPVVSEEDRLLKGPAYEKKFAAETAAGEWPTYRHDSQRSGFVDARVSDEPKVDWTANLGGRLSAVVVVGGKCYVASVDTHTLHVLDADSGNPLWTFTAGGRIDSPPTIHKGRAIFGSADGYVYCLDTADGKLVWRYLAAKTDRRLMANEQLESAWPVHGSVLMREGVVHCVAGRSVFLDGGLELLRIDAESGKLVSRTVMDENIPGTDQNMQFAMKGLNMPPGLPDILSCDDKFLYMRSQKFDFQGKRTELYSGNPSWNEKIAQRSAAEQTGEGRHLFSLTGFLDDSGFHRTYWMFGQKVHSGCNFWFRAGRYTPSARIMVFNDDTVYGFGRQPKYMLWTPAYEYRLFSAKKQLDPESIKRALAGSEKLAKKIGVYWIFNRELTGEMSDKELSAVDVNWSQEQPPLIVRSMVLAGETLFVAGPPDLLDEEAAISRRFDPDVQKQLTDHAASLDGRRGSMLWAVSAADGHRLSELQLDTLPVWDGMAAASGRLFLTTTDGKVMCFK